MTTPTGVTHRKVQVPSNKERTGFLFMRLSGIFLLFLAVGHVMVQHVVNNVHDLSLQFVIMQWSSWAIRIIDLLLLYFALIHGFNGLRNVYEDYIHNRKTVKVLNVLVVIFLIITLAVVTFAVLTFNTI